MAQTQRIALLLDHGLCTVRGVMRGVRVERGKQLLASSRRPVTAVAAQSGFPSVRRLDGVFRKRTDLSRTAYRRQWQLP